jgi:REP element-mobilizing transposase RayT
VRHWLLTNTTFGTWLPGDRRGSVTSVRDLRPEDEPSPVRFEHDLPGEPYEDEIPGLHRSALEQMSGPPIYLDLEKAEVVLAQFQETANYRGWTLLAVAIMANHFHLVVTVPDDPHPRKILADFKAYGTRRLNRHYGVPPSETWWTNKGSKRKLHDATALAAAVCYTLYKQPYPLVVWSPELGRLDKASRERERPE